MADTYILAGKVAIPEPDIHEWGKWFSNANRVVNVSSFFDGDEDIKVSTVFLGLDHSYSGGEPILFETLVFGGNVEDVEDEIE